MITRSDSASGEQSKEIFRLVIEEAFNRGNLQALDDCLAPSYIEHQFNLPPTREELKETIRSLRRTFPSLNLTIGDMVADGDKVWARMTGRATDTEGFMGRSPTGRSFAITVIDVCRFENGKIVEHWGVPDRFHQMLQLGFLAGSQHSGGNHASTRHQVLADNGVKVAGNSEFLRKQRETTGPTIARWRQQ